MKKIFIIGILILSGSGTMACDICGCGVGNNYIGILPDFTKHILGLRYRYNTLLSHLGAGGTQTYLTNREQYNIVELWGGWNLGKKFRVMANLPYNFNERKNQGNVYSKNGLGDITLSGYYQLLNKRNTIGGKSLLVQSLWIGGGIKLPTGKYNSLDKSNSAQSSNLFQLGTASTDFIASVMYDLRIQDMGINLNAGYKFNTKNRYGYTYGNKLNANAQLYYKFRIMHKLGIAPNAGIQYETAEKDIDNKISVYASGGNLLLATAGIEMNFKKIAIGANWQTPVSQDLGEGIVKANNRVMVHVSFLL